jgi:DNA modification methylase
MTYAVQSKNGEELNRLYAEDLPVHEWYRFVLSFPPHLVRQYIHAFGLTRRNWVLDPFCGTGTTLVEAKKNGIPSIGLEANPVVEYIAGAKVDWDVDGEGLVSDSRVVAQSALAELRESGTEDDPLFVGLERGNGHRLRQLEEDSARLLIHNSISPKPLHKALVLVDSIRRVAQARYQRHEMAALAKELVYSAGNLRFGPEVGVGKIKEDAPVVGPWLRGIARMGDDLRLGAIRENRRVPAFVRLGDSRSLAGCLEPLSIDAVITSPPYPNEKDYTRTTRLEAVVLGFLENGEGLRAQKQLFIRSNTRAVYKGDEDEVWVEGNDEVQRLAEEIERRRVAMGKTSGFERLYTRVVKLYFGGMAKHLRELRAVLTPGAQLAYVVGDQASYLRVLIRTGEILASIGSELGYEVTGIDLFRKRFSTATKEELREEVVLLRWPG